MAEFNLCRALIQIGSSSRCFKNDTQYKHDYNKPLNKEA